MNAPRPERGQILVHALSTRAAAQRTHRTNRRTGQRLIAKLGSALAGSRHRLPQTRITTRFGCLNAHVRRGLADACVIEKNLAESLLGQHYCLYLCGMAGTGLATYAGAGLLVEAPELTELGWPPRTMGITVYILKSRLAARERWPQGGSATAQGAPTDLAKPHGV